MNLLSFHPFIQSHPVSYSSAQCNPHSWQLHVISHLYSHFSPRNTLFRVVVRSVVVAVVVVVAFYVHYAPHNAMMALLISYYPFPSTCTSTFHAGSTYIGSAEGNTTEYKDPTTCVSARPHSDSNGLHFCLFVPIPFPMIRLALVIINPGRALPLRPIYNE